MIAEALRYLLTPAGRLPRRSGALSELIAMQARARRCADAWAEHRQNTQAAILAHLPAGRGGRAVVLGSGLLLDIPLKALAAHFDEVVLVDILHMPAVRRLCRGYAGLRLVDMDVTGLLEKVLAGGLAPGAEIPPLPGRLRDLAATADYVISANLLSQLPLLPLRHLARQPGWNDAALARLGADIVAGHIGLLASCRHWLIVADLQRRYFVRGRLEESEDALFGQTLPGMRERWEWPVAPPGELPGGRHVIHVVGLAAGGG